MKPIWKFSIQDTFTISTVFTTQNSIKGLFRNILNPHGKHLVRSFQYRGSPWECAKSGDLLLTVAPKNNWRKENKSILFTISASVLRYWGNGGVPFRIFARKWRENHLFPNTTPNVYRRYWAIIGFSGEFSRYHLICLYTIKIMPPSAYSAPLEL